MGSNGTVDTSSIINNNTYYTNSGKSMTHIINGMAGNIESHSTLAKGQSPLNITCVLDDSHYGLSKLTIHNETVLSWKFVKGSNGESGDDFTLIKRGSAAGTGTSTTTKTTTYTQTATGGSSMSTGGSVTESSMPTTTGTATEVTTDDCSETTVTATETNTEDCSEITTGATTGATTVATTEVTTEDCSETTTGVATEVTSPAPATSLARTTGGVVIITSVVSSYTTYCPGSTTFTQGTKTYTVTEVSFSISIQKRALVTNYYSQLH